MQLLARGVLKSECIMRYHTVSSLRQFDPTHPALHTIGLPHSAYLRRSAKPRSPI
jgi:hypothetical protein